MSTVPPRSKSLNDGEAMRLERASQDPPEKDQLMEDKRWLDYIASSGTGEEKKYIHHMETRKGSDVLARESATKVVKTTRELQSVYDVLNCLEGEAKYHMEGQDCCAAKNTIVRRAFMETQNLRGLGRE